jgi:hypothetical protein
MRQPHIEVDAAHRDDANVPEFVVFKPAPPRRADAGADNRPPSGTAAALRPGTTSSVRHGDAGVIRSGTRTGRSRNPHELDARRSDSARVSTRATATRQRARFDRAASRCAAVPWDDNLVDQTRFRASSAKVSTNQGGS